MAKLILITMAIALTGCAGTHTDSLVFEQQNIGRSASYTGSTSTPGGHGIRASTIHTNRGSFQLISNGSTTTFNQVSRTR